jgi:hypothetical protein
MPKKSIRRLLSWLNSKWIPIKLLTPITILEDYYPIKGFTPKHSIIFSGHKKYLNP